MNIQTNKIDDALLHLDTVASNNPSQYFGYLSAAIVVSLVGIILLMVMRNLRKTSSTKLNVGFVFSVSILVLACSTMALTSSKYMTDYFYAKNNVTEAYKETITDNFNIAYEDMNGMEVTSTDDRSGAYREVRFAYSDLDEMTHYDLIFAFDGETNEPTLLKTANVDSEVIEKLSK